uniref:TRAF-type domain-containing protein n=1 Tax=Chromera velia CCMP2878 TaxID=1169474 RepID=A0A0G4HSV3_9ALVE|mmetsp:Transcript_55111/g.107787  ORF Transcript_55111/g.107787 Transcript_55111/m.107787 type:complete len:604 (+) Transcript_55111:247-2058(+)|eukprot:Cvel_31201.t1-p1 / transcript=Cvel_31201.t1 / gene=Cvel_31201 / organism=Chromera_velia_CCMP2878 / gene_product=TNF receptor-associated factor 6, putative / transcript_product=TNF receptor-associated factor 6, putative / location=Cvel_scaffold4606:298-3205(-) / protein_length=603 / sequence_SO=supercontig / SO=protein_coding / is_pseudo=false
MFLHNSVFGAGFSVIQGVATAARNTLGFRRSSAQARDAPPLRLTSVPNTGDLLVRVKDEYGEMFCEARAVDPGQVDRFICSICYCLVSNPYVLDCDGGHFFCLECLDKHVAHFLQNVKDGNDSSSSEDVICRCPLCNKEATRMHPLGDTMRRYIHETFQWTCTHEREGCKFVGTVTQMSAHIEKECPFVPFTCSDCRRHIPRKDVDSHAATGRCKLPCDLCKVPLSMTEREAHTAECLRRVCCGHCGEHLQGACLKDHLESVCPEGEEICQVEGCGARVRRKHLSQHAKEKSEFHASLLSGQLLKERKRRMDAEAALRDSLHSVFLLRQAEKSRRTRDDENRRDAYEKEFDTFIERVETAIELARGTESGGVVRTRGGGERLEDAVALVSVKMSLEGGQLQIDREETEGAEMLILPLRVVFELYPWRTGGRSRQKAVLSHCEQRCISDRISARQKTDFIASTPAEKAVRVIIQKGCVSLWMENSGLAPSTAPPPPASPAMIWQAFEDVVSLSVSRPLLPLSAGGRGPGRAESQADVSTGPGRHLSSGPRSGPSLTGAGAGGSVDVPTGGVGLARAPNPALTDQLDGRPSVCVPSSVSEWRVGE